jgi:phosphoserine phosphatase
MQPVKLALFDLDGTLTRERSAWEYIHRRLGLWEGHAEKFQEEFLRGAITYQRFCEMDAGLWKGMKSCEVRGILKEIPLYEGIDDFVGYLRSRGLKLGIISSGLSLLGDWMMERYGFDYAVANDLGIDDGVLNGEIRINVHYDQKGEWAQEVQRKYAAGREETLAIGDSTGDITMFQAARLSVAFNSRCSELDALATIRFRSTDMRDLIPALAPHLGKQ